MYCLASGKVNIFAKYQKVTNVTSGNTLPLSDSHVCPSVCTLKIYKVFLNMKNTLSNLLAIVIRILSTNCQHYGINLQKMLILHNISGWRAIKMLFYDKQKSSVLHLSEWNISHLTQKHAAYHYENLKTWSVATIYKLLFALCDAIIFVLLVSIA